MNAGGKAGGGPSYVAPSKPPRPLGYPNPFEGFLLGVAALQGSAVLVGIARPTTIAQALPPILQVAWAALLLVGGALGVTGLYWAGDPFTGVEIKRVGLVFAGFGTLAYGVALLSVGPPGVVASLYNFGFSAACVTRIYQIGKAIRTTRAHMVHLRRKRPARS